MIIIMKVIMQQLPVIDKSPMAKPNIRQCHTHVTHSLEGLFPPECRRCLSMLLVLLEVVVKIQGVLVVGFKHYCRYQQVRRCTSMLVLWISTGVEELIGEAEEEEQLTSGLSLAI